MIDWDTLVTGPCMGVFGEPAEYTDPNGVVPLLITGVYDDAYVEVTPLGDLDRDIGIPGNINDAMPVLGVQLSQFGSQQPTQDGLVRLPALLPLRPFDLLFRVQDIQDDGHGWALLKLIRIPQG